jgi:endonuclease G
LATFTLGLSLGIVSQRIPQIKTYTDEFIHPIEQQISDQYASQNIVKGAPISSFHINRSGYSLAYDARNRNLIWVYEHLTANSLSGSTDRSHFDFKEDTSIPLHLRASPLDYRSQGFDCGHLAPAANHRSSSQAMADTFFMTNMCPQCPQLNRGYWCKLEKYVRDLTKSYKDVYVVTGPLYMPYTDVDGKRYIKYQVIGKNDVAVPSHFFKIITLEDQVGHIETQAYILPNENIPSSTTLDTFRTSVEKIEKVADLILSNKKS